MKRAKLNKFAKFLICCLFLLSTVFFLIKLPQIIFEGLFLYSYLVPIETSYSHHHSAKLYTRPGLGDQNFTLEINGETVWKSGDAMGGDLKAKLIWDKTGHILTMKLLGHETVIYDAKNQIIKHKEFGY